MVSGFCFIITSLADLKGFEVFVFARVSNYQIHPAPLELRLFDFQRTDLYYSDAIRILKTHLSSSFSPLDNEFPAISHFFPTRS